jgi:hypothetical protein
MVDCWDVTGSHEYKSREQPQGGRCICICAPAGCSVLQPGVPALLLPSPTCGSMVHSSHQQHLPWPPQCHQGPGGDVGGVPVVTWLSPPPHTKCVSTEGWGEGVTTGFIATRTYSTCLCLQHAPAAWITRTYRRSNTSTQTNKAVGPGQHTGACAVRAIYSDCRHTRVLTQPNCLVAARRGGGSKTS